jgi:2-polyprenyl-6-methoxyphenol hydroxylase-like FAD-dependent oxidoreductase
MYPRGGNGAGQGILDARSVMRSLAAQSDVTAALKQYEAERLRAANAVVLVNRTAPSDEILKIVHDRSGDRPFNTIDDVISSDEMAAVSESYKRVAGFSRESLRASEFR